MNLSKKKEHIDIKEDNNDNISINKMISLDDKY